jgi:hypothetical protein
MVRRGGHRGANKGCVWRLGRARWVEPASARERCVPGSVGLWRLVRSFAKEELLYGADDAPLSGGRLGLEVLAETLGPAILTLFGSSDHNAHRRYKYNT